MSDFLQYTVFGVMLGAGYAIAATGLVVTYTTSGVFNFAQGAVGMIAAFCYWELVSAHHVPVLAGPADHPGRRRLDLRGPRRAGADAPAARRLGRATGHGDPRPDGHPDRGGHHRLEPDHRAPGRTTWSRASSDWSGSTSSTRRC